MKATPAKTMAKLNQILQAWRDLTPGERFADMTLEEFEREINKSINVRTEITDLENQTTNKTQERDITDESNWELALFVVASVVANRNFGPNSGLYEAMGYVPKSERKSGLTRKKKDGGGNE